MFQIIPPVSLQRYRSSICYRWIFCNALCSDMVTKYFKSFPRYRCKGTEVMFQIITPVSLKACKGTAVHVSNPSPSFAAGLPQFMFQILPPVSLQGYRSSCSKSFPQYCCRATAVHVPNPSPSVAAGLPLQAEVHHLHPEGGEHHPRGWECLRRQERRPFPGIEMAWNKMA